MAVSFTRKDLDRNLDALYLARGEEYVAQGRVRTVELRADENRITAQVNGSHHVPYQVDVTLLNGSTGVKLYGTCTCPMRVNCKHVAAALLQALRAPATESDSSSAPIEPRRASTPRASAPLPAATVLPIRITNWLEQAGLALAPKAPLEAYPPTVMHRLLYVLDVPNDSYTSRLLRLRTMTARLRKAGGYSAPSPWSNVYQAISSPPGFVLPSDVRILRRLHLDARTHHDGQYELTGEMGSAMLAAMIATGRCHWLRVDSPPLRQGAVRRGHLAWQYDEQGAQHLLAQTEPPSAATLPLSPPWYIDAATGECGATELGLAGSLAEMLARAPEIPAGHAARVRTALESQFAGHDEVPLPCVPERVDQAVKPIPCLRLSTLEAFDYSRYRFRSAGEFLDIAALTFDYAGTSVNRDSPGKIEVFREGSLWVIGRDHREEKAYRQVLEGQEFVKVMSAVQFYPQGHKHDYTLPNEAAWLRFVGQDIPELQSRGWRIECDESFRFRLAQMGDWHAEVEPSGEDWFDLKLAVEIDGARTDLVPILLGALRSRPELLDQIKSATQSDEVTVIKLPDGRLLPMPMARLRSVVTVLHELLDHTPGTRLRLSRLDALRLADLEREAGFAWHGGEAQRELGRRLAEFAQLVPMSEPSGFAARLRPYQQQGLAWLQFLREFGFGGILADDMGLGKTVQALAHILLEKRAGRLDRPALVVAPTSVLPNWKSEAHKLAPELRLHVSHGLGRKTAFAQFAECDLLLTSYPLLVRDRQALLAQQFHLVILDEAQQVKNAQTQAARVVRELQARHRLCMTGTPLENHLGELWSLFNFLMPSFLGDAETFRRVYRTPIEKRGDTLRRTSLARRIRPFLLRRTKEQVATELPPKTEIVQKVELAGAQRDLYETVRAAMDQRVRAEIATRGLAKSQIILLDALLKLRQACCDPRLLKLEAAKKVKESAKLDALLDMLDELLAEGRRVLLFSQFTSMLELIEVELKARKVIYVKLTGETQNRERPVSAFQRGDAPLFLISLKAGGTGLNLTAADTVIHYDPWWNPAVENQATDRAHRIGQDKPVFVFKLIAAGTVEEKIAGLQISKAALAAGILGDSERAAWSLTQEDVQALFEPIV